MSRMNGRNGAGVLEITADKPWVLIVDDEQVDRDLYRKRLETAGWLVVAVNSGEEAVSLCKDIRPRRPTVILMDYKFQQGRIRGDEALRRIQELHSEPIDAVLITNDPPSDATGQVLPKTELEAPEAVSAAVLRVTATQRMAKLIQELDRGFQLPDVRVGPLADVEVWRYDGTVAELPAPKDPDIAYVDLNVDGRPVRQRFALTQLASAGIGVADTPIALLICRVGSAVASFLRRTGDPDTILKPLPADTIAALTPPSEKR
jgi:two-component system, OmpR family, phosphate regulon response regulator PhoB